LEAELARGSTGSGRVLHRGVTQELLERAAGRGGKDANSDSDSNSSIVLAGARGSGKSVSLASLVAWSRSQGWITLWCPSPRGGGSSPPLLGACGGTYRWNEAAGGWDTPLAAAAVARALLAAHADALSRIPAPTKEELLRSLLAPTPAGDASSSSSSYPVSSTLLAANTLKELAEVAAGVAGAGGKGGGGGGKAANDDDDDEISSSSSHSLETDAAVALLSALRSRATNPSVPFLVALDDAHALIAPGAASQLWERRKGQGRERIAASELRIVRELARPFWSRSDPSSSSSPSSDSVERSRGLDVAAVEAEGSWSSSSRRRRKQQLGRFSSSSSSSSSSGEKEGAGAGAGEDISKKSKKEDILVVPRFNRGEWDLLMQAWREAGVRGCPPPTGASAKAAEEAAAAAAGGGVRGRRGGGAGSNSAASASAAAASIAVAAAGEAAAASAAFLVAGGAPGKARALHAALL